ncbi:MAG: type VI secretion system-associated FHA domain protein TagH [Caldimonas sp.]
MITLTVVAFNDKPADGTLQVHFDELGGSIGRADTNQLVLPDPERMVSRVAAQVVYRNGAFVIVDRGSNPISLNGRTLVSGKEAPLAAGDRVGICGYELSVKMGSAAADAASDPFSKLLGPAPAARSPGARLVDPLERLGLGPSPAAVPPAPPAGGIPVDWDPFETQPQDAPRPGAPPRRDALGLDIGAAAPAALVTGNMPSAPPSSLDQLFGLSSSGGRDPLADSALDAPMAQPNMAADADPLRSLNSAPKASAASEPDLLSDLQRPFIPPTTIKPATPAPAAPSAASARGPQSSDDAAKTEVRAVPPATPAASADPSPARPPPAAHPVPAGRREESAPLLDAFRRGLNAPALELPALTPELMELIGQILREAVGGTVDLLRARSTLKHEMRADVTTIVAKGNNPLKFSPNAEVALQHLLAPPARGFTPAAPAIRAAFDDLRTHQFGLIAGMQAVLEAALQRFDPVALETKLGEPSMLQSLLPARRNARLWELFGEAYATIRKDATDDFHTLFGDVFLTAYDEQVDRLLQHRRGPATPGGSR